MSSFDSLTLALEAWFDTPLPYLPDALRERIVQEFFPMPWRDEWRSIGRWRGIKRADHRGFNLNR